MFTGIVAGVIIISLCSMFVIAFTKEEGLKGKDAAVVRAFSISLACGMWWFVYVYLNNPPIFLLKYQAPLIWLVVWGMANILGVTLCLTYPLYLIFRPKPTG